MKIYLLHGLGGSPNGTVKLLQEALEPLISNFEYVRPPLPHHEIEMDPNESVNF